MFLLFLALIVFACMGRRFRGRRPTRAWGERFWHEAAERHPHEPASPAEERFEEWHRMTHAKEGERVARPDDAEQA